MNIIIVGNGKVGHSLTKQLAGEGHDVVVIDKNPKVVETVINEFDVMGICGNGASCEIQRQAGVAKADLLIAATQTDELNILCCMLAKKMGTRHSIARVRTPEYSKQMDFMQSNFGISMLVNPEFVAADEISRILRFPSAIKLEPFANGRVELAEIAIGDDNELIGKPVHIIHERYRVRVLVCAVKRGDEAIIPNGDFVIKKGDRIYVTASRPELVSFMRALGLYRSRTRRVMIAGGGKVGYYLAKQMVETTNCKVKIIEEDPARALELSEALPKAEVICGDATEHELMAEQGLEQQDAFVALMGHDEENAIISMYAMSKQVGKVITKASRISSDVLGSIGLDSVVSVKELATDRILRYVRALHNSEGAVRTLYRIVDGKAEALEFSVPNDFAHIGTTFRELKIKKNVLIACILRKNKVVFPGGDDCMERGDTVIVVSSIERLRTLDDMME